MLGSCAFSPPWLVGKVAAAYAPTERQKGLFASARRAAVDAVLARSLYPHFCAGATAEEASRVADRLAEAGVGSILNYAAEEAVEDETEEEKRTKDPDAARDAAAALFLASVAEARPSPREGRPSWIAVKVSALVPPLVLEKASAAVVLASEEAARIAKSDLPLFDRGALACDDAFNRLLTKALDSKQMTEAEVSALRRGEERLRRIGAAAAARGGTTRVIVDAEQTWLQPQIDVLALRAMREFNRPLTSSSSSQPGGPTIMQTYQCYLKSAPRRVAADALRARLEGFAHGAKPVRGAYLAAERSFAMRMGLPDPVLGTIQETHACYDTVVGSLLDGVKEGRAHLLVAVRLFFSLLLFFEVSFPPLRRDKITHFSCFSSLAQPQSHNRRSVEAAVAGMSARNLDPGASPVSFGQLLGMADSLTFGLAARGFDALKILAYGDLAVVCAFLVRRAQENASALGGARAESGAQAREVARRLFGSSSGK